jgi:hypothetical protein
VEQRRERIQHPGATVSARPRLPRPGLGERTKRTGPRSAEAVIAYRSPGRRPCAPEDPSRVPRLTGLGIWVSITLITVAGGAADSVFFGGPGTLFGPVFVAACVTGGLWVRPYDLSVAPISAPIAFALALVLTADTVNGGLSGHVMGLLTGLALQTGWLYAGTLCAAVIVAVRKLAAVRRERRG